MSGKNSPSSPTPYNYTIPTKAKCSEGVDGKKGIQRDSLEENLTLSHKKIMRSLQAA